MDKLISKFDYVMSLGYNCYGKMYLKLKNLEQETQFFDYIATSAWAIDEILENNFDGMFDSSNYKIVHLMKQGPDQYIVLNTTYFIRCKHEFKITLNQKCRTGTLSDKKINENELKCFIDTMMRRKERFMNMFSDNKSILFIRYEEDPTDRLPFPEYEEKLSTPYMENLIKVSERFKTMNPEKRIVILDISHRHDKTEYLKEYGIIKVKMSQRVDFWLNAAKMIDDALKKEKVFLDELSKII